MLSSGGWSQSFNGIDSRSVAPIAFVVHAIAEQESILNVKAGKVCLQAGARLAIVLLVYQHRSQNLAGAMRSEERRVGKECRPPWSLRLHKNMTLNQSFTHHMEILLLYTPSFFELLYS